MFVTAFDQYALDAFQVNAVDYLLKPVARERLAGTVGRLRERLARGGQDLSQLQTLLQQLQSAPPPQPKTHHSAPPRAAASGRRPASALSSASGVWA